jgi:hypothetical protein
LPVEGLDGPSIGVAVLTAKIKINNIVGPPDPAQNHRSPEENDSPGAKIKIKNRLKHS